MPIKVTKRRVAEYALLLAISYSVVLIVSLYIPPFGEHSYPIGEYYLKNCVKDVGAWNVVCAIVWDYRGYDTLGETAVLFTAVVGVVALFRWVMHGGYDSHS